MSIAIENNIIIIFIHACKLNSVLSISGITTYEYVRAHRVAQERQQQLHAERLTASIANQNADDKGRGYKKLSDNSNSSGSQLQWDKLERERPHICYTRNSVSFADLK